MPWDISTNTGSASRFWLLANDRSRRNPPTMEWSRGKGTTSTASPPPESVATAAEATATNPRKAGDSPLSASHARPRNAIRGHGSHLQVRTTERRRGVRIGAEGEEDEVGSLLHLPSVAWRDVMGGATSTSPPAWRVSFSSRFDLASVGSINRLNGEREGVATTYPLPFLERDFVCYCSYKA